MKQKLTAYWKTVVDTIQDGIMIVDPGGVIVFVNLAFETITGYSGSEIMGKSCAILNCSGCKTDRDMESGNWCTLFSQGGLKRKRCVLMRKDGQLVHVLKNASLFHDQDGKVVGAVETMTDITELLNKEHQIEAFQRQLRSEDQFHGIIGNSVVMQSVFDMINNAAYSDAPVIILGESGTGKELVARAIHECGPRKDKPFIKVNCAALNESLLESELFGHVKGAFTGATQNRMGRFEAAHGGDIFLDEIGDIPLATQVKLLRVLEEHVIERVGDNRPIPVDVRIITATNRDLGSLMEEKKFREDFYYRINVIPIHIPPLRERIGDIALLAEHFFNKIRLKSNKPVTGISRETMELLLSYSWPGNVRELKSAFEYAFVTCRDSLIQPRDLPSHIGEASEAPPSRQKPVGNKDERKKLELIEALKKTGGNQSRAAELLGISRVTVWNRMKRYGLRKQS